MFKKRNVRPSAIQHNDQLPFLAQKRFSALPRLRTLKKDDGGLSLVIAVLYVVDLVGVFPFVTLPGLLIPLGLFSIPFVVVVVGIQIYTACLLGKCWIIAEVLDPTISQKSRYPYAAISHMAYGKYVSLLVTILLDLSIFATGIPNLVVASQNLQLIGHRISDGHFDFSFCYWLIIIGICICPLMWLGSPKNMRGVVMFSFLVVSSIVILLWYCLSKAEGSWKPFQGMTNEVPSLFNFVNGFGILAFQFDINSMILTIQIDMQNKEKVKWAAIGGTLTICSLAVITSLISAYKFGSMVTMNILEMLPRSNALYVAIILISVQLCLSCVVGSSALFLHMENFFRVSEELSWKRVVIRSTIFGAEVLLGEFVPKFNVLAQMVGGTLCGPLTFILPPLLYKKITQMEKMRNRIISQAAYGSLPMDLNYESDDMTNNTESRPFLDVASNRIKEICKYSPCELSFPTTVVAFGILVSVSATFLNLFQIPQLFQNNSSCFGNVSKSVPNP